MKLKQSVGNSLTRTRPLGAAALTALVVTAASVQAVHAQTLTDASQYNLFTLGDASNSNVDILGKVAVGGNANFNNYTIGQDQPIGSSLSAVVGGNYTNSGGTVNGSIAAGGNANINNPTVNGNISANGTVTLTSTGTVNGNVTYGKSDSNGSVTVSGKTAQGTTTLPVDFNKYATSLTSQSSSLQSTAATGKISNSYGTLSASGTGSFNVYYLDASLLASSYSLNLTADSGATIVIDVTGVNGSTVTIPNQNQFVRVNGTSLSNVLFNFGDATAASTINLTGFNSSILAPLAKVQGSSGDYHGSLIAGTFAGNGLEIHDDGLFSGAVTNSIAVVPAVPEPGILVTAASMIGMTGMGLVRGRRRQKKSAAG